MLSPIMIFGLFSMIVRGGVCVYPDACTKKDVFLLKPKCEELGNVQQNLFDISGNAVPLDIEYDSYSLHYELYVSDDNSILANHYSDETKKSPNRERRRKQTYSGVMIDRCTQDNSRIYYEISYEYTILSTFSRTDPIFEIGLIDEIDKIYFVGDEKNGWSFALAKCKTIDKICITATHNGAVKFTKEFSDNTLGFAKSGMFSVYIDRVRNTFSFIIDGKVIYSFEDVKSKSELCPVHGAFSPSKVDVRLKIMNGRDFTSYLSSQSV